MLSILLVAPTQKTTAQDKWWDAKVETQLSLAEANSAQLTTALQKTAVEHHKAMTFLISNLGPRDLTTVSGQDLLDNIRLAYDAKSKLPWGDDIPEEIFLNDVLPHFHVDETREAWRSKMFEISFPIVKTCKTPAEAAQKLNEELFKIVNVKYSTKRKQANQSPSESMEQGLASCTGLSILLADACRSVCVPARLVGIPSWPNKRGNHTWIEIWDQDWHFTGAAEPSDKGLNDTWFENDAALADPSSRENSIYAVSFKKTDTTFPMVWSKDKLNPVYAVNVTSRYTKAKIAAPANSVTTMVRVWNRDRTERVSKLVIVVAKDGDASFVGQSKNNEADMNDLLTFELEKSASYDLFVKHNKQYFCHSLSTPKEGQQLFEYQINEKDIKELSPEQHVALSALECFGGEKDESFEVSSAAQDAYRNSPEKMRDIAWKSYLKSPLGQSRKSDFDENRVTFKKHVSPYTIKEVGKRPAGGWPLFIAMHGGGGAPAELNDSQWRHMQIYYKDQAQLEGYKYLALRAPNNTWNGFYDDYVYPLIENLIRQFIVHGDIDANKVFIMGYSHGGYGAFSIGPKIPHRFAAVHASAAAPTDGQTSAMTLRNTRFTFMVGETDTAYGRRERCEKFAAKIKELKGDRDDIFPVEFLYKEGYGHGGLPDRDMIASMYEYDRNVVPKHLTWEMTDTVVRRFFWLEVAAAKASKQIDAKLEGNQFAIQRLDVESCTVYFDERLIDPALPVTVKIGDQTTSTEYEASLSTLLKTIAQTGDINLAFDGKIEVKK